MAPSRLRARRAAILRDAARRAEFAATLLHRAASVADDGAPTDNLLVQATDALYEIGRALGGSDCTECRCDNAGITTTGEVSP